MGLRSLVLLASVWVNNLWWWGKVLVDKWQGSRAWVLRGKNTHWRPTTNLINKIREQKQWKILAKGFQD